VPRVLRALPLLAALLGLAACASTPDAPRFDFFVAPGGEGDVWQEKVAEWQSRAVTESERDHLPDELRRSLGAAARSGRLSVKMASWEVAERRTLARRVVAWTQGEARRHFRFDPSFDPRHDHWPTVGELLANNGDDCDGIDLIAWQLLREFGFEPERLFRLIARRDRDGANHMVTLWFEDGEDPWVLDGTGAMTRTLRRFSEIVGWTPTKMFNDTQQFTVAPRGASRRLALD
jgi:hypothetical protein